MSAMKRCIFMCCVALLLLVLAQCAGVASVAPVKWTQAPDMNRGMTFSSELKVPSIVADDWECRDGLPVTDIHWWGSYWMTPGGYTHYCDSLLPAAPGVLGFNISIWTDVPAVPGQPFGFSHPGDIVKTYLVQGNSNEAFFANTAGGRPVYYYSLVLPREEWFLQEQGKVYWLSIQANLGDDRERQWGWHESREHWNDGAVQNFKGSGWFVLENNIYKSDMSFELTTIPEPGGLLAFGTGMIGLAGVLIRRRRAA